MEKKATYRPTHVIVLNTAIGQANVLNNGQTEITVGVDMELSELTREYADRLRSREVPAKVIEEIEIAIFTVFDMAAIKKLLVVNL
jgi:hypothetical protein